MYCLRALRDSTFVDRVQVKDIGSGNFGVARLCTDNQTGERVAIKYIERGAKVRVSCLVSITRRTRHSCCTTCTMVRIPTTVTAAFAGQFPQHSC